jgi:hypothetical protein
MLVVSLSHTNAGAFNSQITSVNGRYCPTTSSFVSLDVVLVISPSSF